MNKRNQLCNQVGKGRNNLLSQGYHEQEESVM